MNDSTKTRGDGTVRMRLDGDELSFVIEVVEDRIMPALRALPAASMVEAAGSEFRELAHALAGPGSGKAVGIGEVESLFNRLADVASGSPLAPPGLPSDTAFVLRLVLLRELMHHGGFGRVMLLP